jgi:hypothetical protein
MTFSSPVRSIMVYASQLLDHFPVAESVETRPRSCVEL